MIHTRWGNPASIVGYYGKHTPIGGSGKLVLVKVRLKDGGERFRFAHTLVADQGQSEIDKAVDAAPKFEIRDRALKDALIEAQ